MASAAPAQRCHVAVIGAGISGLGAALQLHELGRERGRDLRVLVLEGSARCGGQVHTERVDGLLLEGGPDQLVTHKPAGRALCERLGLDDQLIVIESSPSPVQVVHRGRPVSLPDGLRLMAPTRLGPVLSSPLFSWRGKLRIACEPWIRPRRRDAGDESVGAFVARRYGREMLERVVEPVVGGIFVADVNALSAETNLPRFVSMEREHGSLARALSHAGRGGDAPGEGFVSLTGGLGTLIERLVSRLPDEALRLSARVEGLGPDPATGRYRIEVAGSAPVEADCVVLACPAWAAAAVVAGAAPELAATLGGIDYSSCATVNLAYPRQSLPAPLQGYGCFVPRDAGIPILACSYVSEKFPGRAPADLVLLRVFLGGQRDPDVPNLGDDELAAAARGAVERLLGLQGPPRLQRIYRFPRSVPQHAVGFRDRVRGIERGVGQHPGLFLCGGSLGAFGLPDCIASGQRAAAAAFEFFDRTLRAPLAISRA